MQELYVSIDRHWQARHAVRCTEAAVADRAQQHRAVQKRLLMRFKDRQPSSLAHLDLLLTETFQQLLQLGALHPLGQCLMQQSTQADQLRAWLEHVCVTFAAGSSPCMFTGMVSMLVAKLPCTLVDLLNIDGRMLKHGGATGCQQEEQQTCAETAGRQLSASVRLILHLVQYGFGMSADGMAVLRKHLSPEVQSQSSRSMIHAMRPIHHRLMQAVHAVHLLCFPKCSCLWLFIGLSNLINTKINSDDHGCQSMSGKPQLSGLCHAPAQPAQLQRRVLCHEGEPVWTS